MITTRRRLLLATPLATALWPRVGSAQQPAKMSRVALLAVGSPQTTGAYIDAVKDRLRELNYVEGKNIVFDVRWAMGDLDRLPDLARELVALGPDVIWAGTTQSAIAARRATTNIPIVVAALNDPVASGFAESLARPGGNVTGVANLGGDTSAKLLELLRTVLPRLSRAAVLRRSAANAPSTLNNLRVAAQNLTISLVIVDVATAADIESGFARMAAERVEGVIIPSEGLFFVNRRQIAGLVIQHRLPSIFQQREYVEAGGLMSYGQNLAANFRHSAMYVDRILRGAKPGDLPIEQATTLELVVNARAAKALGLTIPKAVLLRADEVIE